MISGPSAYAESVDSVMLYIVAVSGFFLIGITVAMIYFVYKYSRKKHPVAKQIHGSVFLEILWLAVPTLLVLSMFWYGFTGFNKLRKSADDAYVIKVKGQMWKWEFTYPNGKTTDTLYIPNGKTIRLDMKSIDVNHSFYIPAFRLKEDVIASRTTYMVLTPEKEGTFDIACAEYCGLNHSYKYSKLHVVDSNYFNIWLEDTANSKTATPNKKKEEKAPQQTADKMKIDTVSSSKPETKTVEVAAKTFTIDDYQKRLSLDKNFSLLAKNGCITCHSTDGSKKIGPSFLELNSGETIVKIDGKSQSQKITRAYLKESILEPDKKIVKGYQKYMMPTMQGRISSSDLESIINILMVKS